MRLDPRVYDHAAQYITEHGWWGGGSHGKPPLDELPAACISNAIGYNSGLSTTAFYEYQTYLVTFLGVKSLEDVFLLNDKQPEATGKQWAVDTLRAAAASLREGVVTDWESEGGA